MADHEDPKNKIIKLMGEAASKQEEPRRPRKQNVVKKTVVNGDGNVVGNGNTVIKTEKVVHKTIARPQPGEEHITEEQVRRLHDLKDQIIILEQAAKRDPATPQRIWSALNKKMRVGSMRMIPLGKFKAAEKYMLEWIGQLMDRPAAKKNAPDTIRRRRIAYIQTNMKKLDIEPLVRAYMSEKCSASSLADLDLTCLEKVYRYVASKKSA